jgi:ketosteroid isomerase-like protein
VAGLLELIEAARLRHPAPELLVVTGGRAFPYGEAEVPAHVEAMVDAEIGRATGDVERALAIFAEDVVFHADGRGTLAGPWFGREGVVRFFSEWLSAWEDHEARLELVVDCGDRMVTQAVQRGRSRLAGVHVEMVNTGGWWLRDGKVALVHWYASLADALAA